MKLELFQKHCKEKRTRKNVHRLEVTLLKETRRLLTGFKIFFVSRAASTGNSTSSLASKDQRDNHLERSRGGVRGRLPLIGRTPATGPGWPLTPATRSALSSGIVVLVASWYNTTRSSRPRRPLIASPLVVHARVTVYYTHLVEPARRLRTMGAEFCAERQTIAAKWLNCSQLNKCSNRIQARRERRGARERSSLLSPASRQFPLYI